MRCKAHHVTHDGEDAHQWWRWYTVTELCNYPAPIINSSLPLNSHFWQLFPKTVLLTSSDFLPEFPDQLLINFSFHLSPSLITELITDCNSTSCQLDPALQLCLKNVWIMSLFLDIIYYSRYFWWGTAGAEKYQGRIYTSGTQRT